MSSRPSLLSRQYIEVACHGELVLLQMGNLHFSIEFPIALRLAVVMRYQAGIAKAKSGDITRGFYCVGVLTDLAAEKQPRKRFMQKLPELLRAKGLSVDTEGQLVVFKLGHTTAKLPYQTARTLAQWLRVRGKEAKSNANEPRHWSEIARQVPALINGHAA